ASVPGAAAWPLRTHGAGPGLRGAGCCGGGGGARPWSARVRYPRGRRCNTIAGCLSPSRQRDSHPLRSSMAGAHPVTAAMAVTEPLIRVHRVSKYFNDQQVLQAVDLEVAAGRILTLIGPSGCGK